MEGAWLGEHPKIWDPLTKNVLDQNWRGSGLREHPKKLGPLPIFATVEAIATEKLVHNMSSGLPCQTQALGRV